MRFEGRVALVTGGGGGIGAAVATRLAAEGSAVVVMGRTPDALAAVVEQVRSAGGDAEAAVGDVRERTDVEAAVGTATERFGGLHLLVTCHGANRDRMSHRMSDEEWDEVVDTHLGGTFRCAKVTRAAMGDRGFGRMVFLSSGAVRGSIGQANYAAAKGGILALVRTLALEYGPASITVNSVIPGFIDTRMTRAVAERTHSTWDELRKTMAERTALQRIGTPADVAGVVAFLCSDDAAFVTGQNLWVRGGP